MAAWLQTCGADGLLMCCMWDPPCQYSAPLLPFQGLRNVQDPSLLAYPEHNAFISMHYCWSYEITMGRKRVGE